jgi:hypothetical protein
VPVRIDEVVDLLHSAYQREDYMFGLTRETKGSQRFYVVKDGGEMGYHGNSGYGNVVK